MTAIEMQAAINKYVWLKVDTLRVLCMVDDVKVSFGQPRFLIRPIAGNGSQWMEIGRLEKYEKAQPTSSNVRLNTATVERVY
jgi:hypothetical protein